MADGGWWIVDGEWRMAQVVEGWFNEIEANVQP